VGAVDRAVLLGAQVLARQRAVLGDDHPDTLTSIGNLALYHAHTGDRAGAVRLLSEALEARRRVLGDEHPATRATAANLESLR
jgi:hypothetical protein